LVSAPNGVQAGRELSHVITSNGFEINAQKVRLQFWNRRQEVTGLTVNNFPNTSRKYVRQIRAMLHAWEKYELAAAEQEHHLRYRKKYKAPFHKRPRYSDIVWGKLAYFASIRSPSNAIFKKLLSRYLKLTGQTVQPNTSLHPSKPDLAMASDALWVLECEESVSQGSAFYLEGVGLVTCAHVLGPKTKAFRHDNITVTYELEVVATNETIDLAILRFKTPPARLSTLKRGKSDLVEHLDEVFVWGFPNYRHGDSSIVSYGRVAGFRVVSTIKRIIVNAPIVEGSSGGPVLNKQGEVIGVAVTGAPSMKKAHETEDHGAIAISAIEHLLKK